MTGVCQAAVVGVAAGDNGTCALRSTGQVKCWGSWHYAVGLGDQLYRGDEPGEMGDALPAIDLGPGELAAQIASTDFYKCALLTSGGVKCWGYFVDGMVGDEPGEMGANLPFLDLGGEQPLSISGRSGDLCVRLTDARALCWSYGQVPQATPGALIELGATGRLIDLSLGSLHECALFEDGRAGCWGLNNYGQLGLGDTLERPTPLPGVPLTTVDVGTGRGIVQISAGNVRTCVVLDDRTGKCWGLDGIPGAFSARSELGYAENGTRGDEPGEMGDALPALPIPGRVARIETSAEAATLALLENGEVYYWGLSGGPWPPAPTPVPVVLRFGRKAIAVSVGIDHACAILDSGQLTCWGGNSYGELGLGDTEIRSRPAELPEIDLGEG
jgi:alpha-tubulin suppressor-like RCC1 family protein